MPLTSPKNNESKDEFIKRCMSDEVMKKEFPKKSGEDKANQRYAVCMKQWEKREENNNMDLIKRMDEYLGESTKRDEVANFIRDHLSGTDRRIRKEDMFNLAKRGIKGLQKKTFNKVFDELVEDGYLIKAKGNTYKWEM